MPSGYVPITDSASATRKARTFTRTDGSDTVEEWLQALSEPILAAYTITVTAAVTPNTANSHLLQIMAGASLRVGLRWIKVTQLVAGTATGIQFELRRLTTAGTGGTAYTPAPNDPADSASGATAMTLPTGKGTEAACIGVGSGQVLASVTATQLLPVFDREWDLRDSTKSLWIAAGAANGIALKNVTAAAGATTLLIEAGIVEASWA